MTTATELTTAPTLETETRGRALLLCEQAGRVPEITDDATNGKAGDLVAFLIAAAKKWTEAKEAKAKPLHAAWQAALAEFKPLAEQIEAAKRSVQAKQTAYLLAKEARIKREAAEAAAKAQEAALAAAAAAEAKGDAVGAEQALEAALTVPTAVKVTARGDFGSAASLRSTWSAEVTDFAALPDQYKLADMSTLGALARGSRPAIPGVRWIETKSAVTR